MCTFTKMVQYAACWLFVEWVEFKLLLSQELHYSEVESVFCSVNYM